MGFVPFPDRPPVPPPPPVLPRILHAPPVGDWIHGPTIDDVREQRQDLRRSRRQTQRGEGSSSSAPAPEPHSFDTLATMMAHGFETLTLGQDRLLRHVSDLQQRHLDLARHVQDLETVLPYQPAELFPAYLLDAYRSPSLERTVDDSADGWGSWPE